MPTVRLSFSPAAAHVRTARLVGVAVARRAGVAEELLEEVRLAIGEACSRAVALHRSHGLDDLVDVAMADGDRFTVRVVDRAANGAMVARLAGETGDEDSVMVLSDPALPLTTPPELLALSMISTCPSWPKGLAPRYECRGRWSVRRSRTGGHACRQSGPSMTSDLLKRASRCDHRHALRLEYGDRV